MLSVHILNSSAESISSIQLEDYWLKRDVHNHSMWLYTKMYLGNQRQGNASVKTRSFVAGSSVKPWKQKGTGRARAGSKKSPIWRGGGVVHGPNGRSYRTQLPKKVRRLAYFSALKSKIEEGHLFIIDNSFWKGSIKTKDYISFFDKFYTSKEKKGSIKLLHDGNHSSDYCALKNIPYLSLKTLHDCNVYDIMVSRYLLVQEEAWSSINEKVGSFYA